jgi:hypothetical protein
MTNQKEYLLQCIQTNITYFTKKYGKDTPIVKGLKEEEKKMLKTFNI